MLAHPIRLRVHSNVDGVAGGEELHVQGVVADGQPGGVGAVAHGDRRHDPIRRGIDPDDLPGARIEDPDGAGTGGDIGQVLLFGDRDRGDHPVRDGVDPEHPLLLA